MESNGSTPRRRGTPLRPLTPFGQDLVEDTPSKIRARHASEIASVRKRLEAEVVEADLEAGAALHEQAKRASLRKAEEAKADAALRKERIVGVMQDKVRQREAEAERRREEVKEEAEQRKWQEGVREKRKKELAEEKRECIESRAADRARAKEVKAAEEAKQRAKVAMEYAEGIAEMRNREAKEKAARQGVVEARKERVLAVRAQKAAEREASLKANSDALKMSRENARQREAARKQEAEEHKQLLRERAADYRTNKELAKTSAFTR